MPKDNYIDLTVQEVYDVLCSGDYWPTHFKSEDKKQLLEKMIAYFAGIDEYEKCIRLQKIMSDVDKSKNTN